MENRQTHRRKPELLFGTETCENALLIPEQASSQWEKSTSNKTSEAQDRAVTALSVLVINMCVSVCVCVVQHLLPLIHTRARCTD